jgi:hypothetical protein
VVVKSSIFEKELGMHNWNDMRQAHDLASSDRTDVAGLLGALKVASSEAKAEELYWGLELSCFPSFLLTETCRSVVVCVFAMLADDDMHQSARIWSIEVLHNILSGSPHEVEIDAGMSEIVEQCEAACRDGIWMLYLLYRRASGHEKRMLKAVLEMVDTDAHASALL